jgi:outer membrane protein TolC
MKRPGSIFLFILTTCCSFGQVLFADSNDRIPAADSRRLTIQEAVQMALAHSPEILLAEARVKRTGESVREARSLNLPQAAMQTGYAYNYGFPMGAPSIFKISGSQSILNSKNANLIKETQEAVKASQIGSDLSRNELASKIASVYYQLHQARKIISLTSIRLEKTRKQQEVMEASLGSGQVRPIDSIIAKTAVAAVQQQLLVAREQAKVAEAELQEMTGIPGTTSIQTVDPVMESPIYESDEEVLFQQSIKSNPEILQTETAIRAKEFHVAAEKAENRPRLDAVTEYSLFSRTNNYEDYYRRFQRNNYIVGISVQIPLFNGFRTSARVAQSKHEVDEEQYKLQRIKSNLRISIQRGLSALRIARGASALAAGDLEAAKEMIQVNSVLLESGRISMKEFEEAQLQLQQKELVKLEADQTLFQRKLELLRITGSILSTLQ